ncbi:hypothetical protein Tco_0118129, partial [Tanacetum coccineum]
VNYQQVQPNQSIFSQPAVHFQQTQPTQTNQTNQTGQQYPNSKEKYEIWAMKMEYWIQNADHNLWRIADHPPVSLNEHVAVQRENKVVNTTAGSSMVLLVVIPPAARLVSAGSSMFLLVVIPPAASLVSAGSSMVLLVVIFPAARLDSAVCTIFLLVVIVPAGFFVPAGSYGLCCW